MTLLAFAKVLSRTFFFFIFAKTTNGCTGQTYHTINQEAGANGCW